MIALDTALSKDYLHLFEKLTKIKYERPDKNYAREVKECLGVVHRVVPFIAPTCPFILNF